MTGEDRTTPRYDDDFLVNVNGRTFTHKFPEGFAEPPVTDPTREAESEGWAELTDRELLGQVIGVLGQAEHELPHQSPLWAEVATMAGHVRRRLAALSTTPATNDAERLAALIHDAMPDENDWQLYFRRIDEPDGWSLEIRRSLSERIAAAISPALSTTPAPDEPEWPALANDIRTVDGNHDLGAGALAEALIERGWTRRRRAMSDPTLREALQAILDIVEETSESLPTLDRRAVENIARAALSTTPAADCPTNPSGHITYDGICHCGWRLAEKLSESQP